MEAKISVYVLMLTVKGRVNDHLFELKKKNFRNY